MSVSPFFEKLFSLDSDSEKVLTIADVLDGSDPVVYRILFNFISTGWVVLPDIFSEETLMGLIVLADYFCIDRLAQICCNELTAKIGT